MKKESSSEVATIRWDDIPNVMNRYSWNAKMHACGVGCSESLWQGRQWNNGDLTKVSTPWELNVFASLATIYSDGPEELMPRSVFIAIIECIRERCPQTPLKTWDDMVRYLCRTALIQFQYQQEPLLLFLRYRYLFSVVDVSHNLDLPATFRRIFRVSVEDVLCFQLLIYLSYANDMPWVAFVRLICQKYGMAPTRRMDDVIDIFSIERKEYAKRQSSLNEFSTDGVINSINLMEQYPFVKMGNKCFLPLPYLLSAATGRHLFDRLMSSKKDLRSKVGHWAMEPYVYDLFVMSHAYDFVGKEFRYKVGKKDRDSPDLYVTTQGETIFVEVKLIEAPIELRQGFAKDIEFNRAKTAKHLYQIYSRMREILDGYASRILKVQEDSVWGLVVVHEDSYLVRDDIYNHCFLVHPELSEEDREFIRKRIAIASLYEVENFCYRHRCVLPALKTRALDRTSWSNMMLDTSTLKDVPLDFQHDEVINDLVRQFVPRLFSDQRMLHDEMN